jgi:glycosyltransferase involved in cell wall biosynthesis
VKLLLAGRLTRIKGHLLIVEAARRMREQGTDNFLIIFAGDDQGRVEYRQEVENAVAAAGLADEIRLVGHCDDMPAAYQICDIAMLPTIKPESFGRTAVEPQVMGKPVLASDHGGTTETVVNGETGWLVKVDAPDAWALAMTRAVEMGGPRLAAMGQAAANRARRLYSVEAMCEATLDAYTKVLAARRSRFSA